MRDLRNNFKILASAILSLCSFQSLAQEHLNQRPERKWLSRAEEEYEKGHYQLAMQSAKKYLDVFYKNIPDKTCDERQKASYYKTLAQLKLQTPGAGDSALAFLNRTSQPAYRQRVSFALGQFFFKKEALSEAIPYYESASISNLTNEEIADSKFELAYAYFNSRQFEKAEPLFASIKEVQGKYYLAGNYYYGLLAYNEGKYEEALNSFRRIVKEPQYKNIVPYYIAEIYYFMGNRKQALEEAIRLISSKEKIYYDNELHLLAAQVLFEEQRYGEALPYFEHYYENTDKIRKEELYEMGYSYYRVNEWKNAIEKFKPLSNAQDSLGQTAMYLLGDCYLKTGNKKSARNAFSICADMPYNAGQQQAALLLYGKLSYEMGFNDDALRSFRTLARDFPGSPYSPEAKTFLSDLLIKTNNYSEAFATLRDVNEKSRDYWNVWQKVTYGYAMQQIQQQNLGFADSLLALSLQQPVAESYEAAALFWRGDIAYRQDRPADALNYLSRFSEKAGGNRNLNSVSPQATLANANLTMGYAAMMEENFSGAQDYFGKARQAFEPHSSVGVNASMREADAAFMQKDYQAALSLYDKAIAINNPESDYARLQKAVLLGAMGNNAEKIPLLREIINRTPASKYNHEARYELAVTYIEEEKYRDALTQLQNLTSHPDARNFAARAWLKTGFAYQQQKENTQAIAAYKTVITDFPAGEEKATALEALRSLYIETNQPEAYAKLLEENNIPGGASVSLDSTYYAAAEAQIAAGKWDDARTTLSRYLEKFPNGFFTTKAHYYKAESHYNLKELSRALSEYDKVLETPWNEFSEASAKRAAEISYKEGNFRKSAAYFGQLRNSALSPENLQLAYNGLMRSAFNNQEFEQATAYADTLLALPETDKYIMSDAQLYKAKALMSSNKLAEALEVFKQLQEETANENAAAEARYKIAEIYLLQNNLKEAEAAAAHAIKLNTGNEFWVVKSYILIADVLVKQKDFFNAKATLQSVVKNTRNAALKKEAGQKLNEVIALEKQKSKLKEE